jgi:Domain of unknown function (DUF4129)
VTDPSSPWVGARNGRAVALGVAAVGLLSLVALASQGPLLRARTHDRPGELPSWLTGVFTLAVVVAAALLIYVLAVVRRDRRPKRTVGMWSVLIVVAIAVVASLFMHSHRHRRAPPPQKPVAAKVAPRPSPAPGPTRPPARTGATWLEVVALATAALVAIAAATRPRRQPAGGAEDDPLAALVGDSLEGLRAEPDPRRAVIAAYARMERGLGRSGLARARSETALEYLGRVLADRRVSPAAVTRLTNLFQRAKFSDHTIGADAKEDAIDALEAIRDELQTEAAAVAP